MKLGFFLKKNPNVPGLSTNLLGICYLLAIYSSNSAGLLVGQLSVRMCPFSFMNVFVTT